MRTFIAIKITPDKQLLQAIISLKQTLSTEGITWADVTNLHITLKFLGETTDSQAEQIMHLLKDFASVSSPVTFRVSDLGFFKSHCLPRVLFAGIHEDDGLRLLAKEVENLVAPLGYAREKRPYRPHLTLARIKYLQNKKSFYQAVELNQYVSSDFVDAREIWFLQSQLTTDGAVYHELARNALAGSGQNFLIVDRSMLIDRCHFLHGSNYTICPASFSWKFTDNKTITNVIGYRMNVSDTNVCAEYSGTVVVYEENRNLTG